jgi:hypothetical protein
MKPSSWVAGFEGNTLLELDEMYRQQDALVHNFDAPHSVRVRAEREQARIDAAIRHLVALDMASEGKH